VIDGATDLGPPGLVGPRGGAAWLAGEAHAALLGAADAPLARLCQDLAVSLETRYAAARTREPLGRWALPMASILVARFADSTLDYAWLGDCAAILRSGGRVTRLGPAPAERDAETQMATSVAQHGLGKVGRSAPILEELRRSRSEPGKRVLGVEAETMQGLAMSSIACAPGDELLLMSDGFAALVDSYAVFDQIGLMEALSAQGLADLALQLRAVESADAACERFPRFKGSDDATALWLRIGD
jgi:serine/threonine protein phosphatase PrpC